MEHVVAYSHGLGGIGAQPHCGNDGLDGVAVAEVDPVLLGEVVEGDEVVPVTVQAVGCIRLSLSAGWGAVATRC